MRRGARIFGRRRRNALTSTMRNKLIVGNWKMNGDLATNARLLERLARDWR